MRARGVQLLRTNVKRFRGGLVFKARGLVYHSALGLRVIKKTKKLKVEGGGNMYEGIGGDGKKRPALPPATSVLRTN